MTVPRIHIGRPQRIAALLLLAFFAECLWVVDHQQISTAENRFARCGSERWERPAPLAEDSNPCGNLNGDGMLASRVAELPLTVQRLTLIAADRLRAPANRLDSDGFPNGAAREARHEMASGLYLMRLPFVLFAVWLGGGLWWVTRRLFGNEGGFLALGLYCFCPAVVRLAVTPNNDILAMWGLYGLVYSAMGVAHAMQGPRRKWRPRIALLTVALGLTAAAHLLAAIVGLLAALCFMLYLAQRRRSLVVQILLFATVGALAILFAFYGFHPAAFRSVFSVGTARLRFSLADGRSLVESMRNVPILTATGAALLLYCAQRRSRYFGNTAPLLMVLVLTPLIPTQPVSAPFLSAPFLSAPFLSAPFLSAPFLWALPFLFTFIGGVFSDALETRYRKLFLVLTAAVLMTQAIECLAALPTNPT
jgi:hypothetical protein